MDDLMFWIIFIPCLLITILILIGMILGVIHFMRKFMFSKREDWEPGGRYYNEPWN